ncbi:MAG: rhamnulose-1-phosphate aldolase [Clostridia bacterium]|nr:rhamnulose-1-phosphate aldolase [Clostridia bacterium]
MKDIMTAPFVTEMRKTTANMYRLGWDERNGGNISYLLDESEVKKYLDPKKVLRRIPTGFDAAALAGKYFIVTGTGKYFKNVDDDPETNLGVLRIAEDGTTAELLWGYKDGGRFTSEFPAHMMSHIARLEKDPANRVVMHCHPTNLLAMNYVHELDEKKFTHTLWEMCTECIVVFPDGVGVLPWMLCGTNDIGVATANKMKEFRVVVWALHGVYGAGKTMDETFGLIETVEKAAQIYMLTAHLPRLNTIKDEDMVKLAELFKVDYRKDFLNLK